MKIEYQPSKTIAKFHQSAAEIKGLMGPIGSGKSVGCCVEIFMKCMDQPANASGVRNSRWAIIRNTYPMLRSTTIKTWQEWFPSTVCPITYTAPITGTMKFPMADGTRVEAEILFLALDKPKDVDKLLSLELSGVWVNEARELDFSVVFAAYSRTGRYPREEDAPLKWTGLIMDTNPPDEDHWWYTLAESKAQEFDGTDLTMPCEFFRQPGALIPVRSPDGRISGWNANPEAENVRNHQLRYEYWLRYTRVPTVDIDWLLVMCCGEYGNVYSGKPVYMHAFNEGLHVSSRPLGVFRGVPLILGWDFGLTPACIIGQVAPSGQLRILRELVCERGGIKQFAADAVIPTLNTLFPGMEIDSVGDPAGVAGSQADIDLSPMAMLAQLGIPTRPASGNNDLEIRRNAVMNRLYRNVDEGKPALLLDPSCKMLSTGFKGGYKFERVQITGEERYRDKPAKNKWSHPHDALQNLVIGVDSLEIHEAVPPPPITNDSWEGII